MDTFDKIWGEFERHYMIEKTNFDVLYGNFRLIEEGNVKNYSSFPHSIEMWHDFVKYIKNYMYNNEPKEHELYGKYYVITIPSDFTEYRFWDRLDLKLRLLFNKNATLDLPTRYWITKKSPEEINYIKENGRFSRLKIDIGELVTFENPITNELLLDFMHEFLHAYEDLQRIIKGNKGLGDYLNTTNYYDYINKRVGEENENYREINRLCTLFHFFNKSEIRALISQLSGEIRNANDIDPLTLKDFLENTPSWMEIKFNEKSLELLKKCSDLKCQTDLINTFNEHSLNKKVRNYKDLIDFLDDKFFNVKQYIFKKVSKIVIDKEKEQMLGSIQ